MFVTEVARTQAICFLEWLIPNSDCMRYSQEFDRREVTIEARLQLANRGRRRARTARWNLALLAAQSRAPDFHAVPPQADEEIHVLCDALTAIEGRLGP